MDYNKRFTIVRTDLISKYSFAIVVFFYIGRISVAQTLEDYNISPGGSNSNTVNINYRKGNKHQDIKRSTFLLVVSSGEKARAGSATLINTVKNSRDSEGHQKFYILTAAHIIHGLDEGNLQWYFTTDYELPHKDNRGTLDDVRNFSVHQVEANVAFLDIKADILLLSISIDPTNPETPPPLEYSYAAGWNRGDARPTSNISHPQRDIKKIFYSPQDVTSMRGFVLPIENTDIEMRPDTEFLNMVFYKSKSAPVNLEQGSSGSALLDESHEVMGVASSVGRKSHFSKIGNSWWVDVRSDGLINYLDPDKSWIGRVPGGYVNDLRPPEVAEFDLEFNTLEMTKEGFNYESGLEAEGIFPILGTPNAPGLKSNGGIWLTENTVSSPIYLTIVDQRNNLVYGVSSSNDGDFQHNSWQVSDVPIGLDYTFQNDGNWRSDDFKNGLLQAISEESRQMNAITGIIDYVYSLDIKLSNPTNNQVKVRAINIPGHLPLNAKEFFGEDIGIDDILTSNKYFSSNGNAINLYIDKLTIRQNDTQKEISSSGNGGYLNLVNPEYKIGPISTSTGMDDSGGQGNEITFELIACIQAISANCD